MNRSRRCDRCKVQQCVSATMCALQKIKMSTSERFELSRSMSNGLAIHRLNHSATMSCEIAKNNTNTKLFCCLTTFCHILITTHNITDIKTKHINTFKPLFKIFNTRLVIIHYPLFY